MPSSNDTEQRRDWTSCFLEALLLTTRILGVFTGIVLLGVGVDLTFHQRPSGIYILLSSVLVSWIEIIWVVTLFLHLCSSDDEDNGWWRCWRGFCWLLNGWRRSLIYICLAVVPIQWSGRLWLSPVAAAQLLLLAVLHLMVDCCSREKTDKRTQSRRRKLLHPSNELDSCESSSRFEEIGEVLDDRIPAPMPSASHHVFTDNQNKPEVILEL